MASDTNDECILATYDDGSRVVFGGYTGGAHNLGVWGGITIVEEKSDGTSEVWTYERTKVEPGLTEGK